jgi:CspA family cold shock protein
LKRGRVHWYSKNLGHEFIMPEDGGPQAFVRREDIVAGEEEDLENNDEEVSYEEIRGTEGPEASKVSKV